MSTRPRPAGPGGRHELGQNFLVDRRSIEKILDRVDRHPGPVFEIGPGDGVLSRPLAARGRRVTAVELDPRRATALERRRIPNLRVVEGDVLRVRWPSRPHVVVGNLPFHLTTPILRRLLHESAWPAAIVLVQWEVARRRAGVGGSSLLTAQWWPWFEFELVARVPANAFRPRPGVDGGILEIRRRPEPLVDDRRAFQQAVARMFTGPGDTVRRSARRAFGVSADSVRRWERRHGVDPRARPKDLSVEHWVSLFDLSRGRSRP